MMVEWYNATITYVIIGNIFIAVTISALGTLVLLQRNPLSGDAIAHAQLPGICFGFLIVGKKEITPIIIGATVCGLIACLLIDYIPKKSKIKKDTATSLVLSIFFGVGLLLISFIQNSKNVEQSGLYSYLLGDAASMQKIDILIIISLSVIILTMLIILMRLFHALLFDEFFIQSIGWPVNIIRLLLNIFIVLAIVLGSQSIGLILINALLIIPAALAPFWTQNFYRRFIVAIFFAILSAIIGSLLSAKYSRLPTGASIVLSISFFAFISFFLAPQKGVLTLWKKKNIYKKKVLEENLLKKLYELQKVEKNADSNYSLEELLLHYPIKLSKMKKVLQRLKIKDEMATSDNKWRMTKNGSYRGEKILEMHLLWEAYLIHYMKISPDHVHQDAESIEHLLTPELACELRSLLK